MFVPCLYVEILEDGRDRPSSKPQLREVRARRGNTNIPPPDSFVLAKAGFDSVTLGTSANTFSRNVCKFDETSVHTKVRSPVRYFCS